MTPRRSTVTQAQMVRVNTKAEFASALDALWLEGGPAIVEQGLHL